MGFLGRCEDAAFIFFCKEKYCDAVKKVEVNKTFRTTKGRTKVKISSSINYDFMTITHSHMAISIKKIISTKISNM